MTDTRATNDPYSIIAVECAKAQIDEKTMRGRKQGVTYVQLRQAIAHRLWLETDLSLVEIARRIGRRDHSSARDAILSHQARIGHRVANVSQLRDPVTGEIDWTRFSYLVAAHIKQMDLPDISAAARALCVGRGELRKIARGQSVSADTLLRLCKAASIEPLSLLFVTHETHGKHLGKISPAEGGLRPKVADARSRSLGEKSPAEGGMRVLIDEDRDGQQGVSL